MYTVYTYTLEVQFWYPKYPWEYINLRNSYKTAQIRFPVQLTSTASYKFWQIIPSVLSNPGSRIYLQYNFTTYSLVEMYRSLCSRYTTPPQLYERFCSSFRFVQFSHWNSQIWKMSKRKLKNERLVAKLQNLQEAVDVSWTGNRIWAVL